MSGVTVHTAARVSVVMPTHNRPALLAEAVDSVRQQSFDRWELIIVDDASAPPVPPDRDPRVQVLRHDTSRGGAAAKNTGIEAARGEIVAFLDDDDLYAAGYLEQAVAVLDAHPELDVVFMGVTWFGANGPNGQRNYDRAMAAFLADGRGRREGSLVEFGDEVVPALLRSVPMALQRPVVRRTALHRIGLYRSDCLLWDCDWAIRAALNARVAVLDEPLYCQRSDGQGYSSRRDRTLEHLLSNVEIKDRLYRLARQGEHTAWRSQFRRAAGAAWFDLAWHHHLTGRRGHALKAVLTSASRRGETRHVRLLVRLAIPIRRGAGMAAP